jgi:hypothetical protein
VEYGRPLGEAAAESIRELGLHESNKERAWAVFEKLKIFHAKAIEMGFPSIATAALIGWEFLQRKDHIFTEFRSITIGRAT